ncbi:MAG: HAMP domain-containing histidine kinase [Actinomycetota bacterium]|nr:HAMP domain-containing histidine kinase [Actinomycetota bacterium]
MRARSYGLRPRLLAALLFTSAVTLAAAALVLLPPLQDRLRRQSIDNLQSAVLTQRPAVEKAIQQFPKSPGDRRIVVFDAAQELRSRIDGRVVVTDAIPRLVVDTNDFLAETPPPMSYQTLINRGVQRVEQGNQATVGVRLFGDGGTIVGVVVVQKQLDDVTAAVEQVRNAFLAAAAIGLGVAFLLGLGLATTLSRRLTRLRAAALRVAEEGTDAPAPHDDGRDEVGDLARTLAAMQAALRRQEQARRAFVATASHELRTPLTSLSGTLELLREDLQDRRFDRAEADDQVAGAQVQLQRLTRLATELLDLSRLDAAVPLRSEPVELGELCRAVAAEFELRAADGRIDLDVPRPPGPCWGRGDPDAVARVARILLDNALRHAPEHTPIVLRPEYHGDDAHITVSDRGPGVAAEDRERIFERFERGSAPSGEGGFGLGLAIGRELAERMGGHLGLDDGRDGPGATFVLSLPIELPSGSRAADDAPARA